MINKLTNNLIISATLVVLHLPVTQNQVYASVRNDGAKQNQRTQKPNILFISIDDLKPDLGCYGNSFVKTPNIDRIAEKGTVFANNHCQQAICGPTRASLMTGKRPDYTKVWDLRTRMRDINPNILTLPQYLREQGYITAGIGKIFDGRCVGEGHDLPSWSIPYYTIEDQYYYNSTRPILSYYHDPEIRKQAEDAMADATRQGLTGADAREYVSKTVKPSVECLDLPDHAYRDGAIANQSKSILSELAKSDKPFFFAVGFDRPHLPFVAPKKYWDLYNRDNVPLAQYTEHAVNSPEFAYHDSGELRTYSDIPGIPGIKPVQSRHIGLPVEKQKELVHGYYASVSYVDAQVGKLLDELERIGLAENTIIVLWGDHGWHLGDHDQWCKHTNFEQATRSPLIISAPAINKSFTTSPTEFIDVFPTICDMAGIEIPDIIDGKSLVPIMKKPKVKVKDFAVSQYPRGQSIMGYSIRTGRHRLTWWMGQNYRSNMPFDNSLILAKELYDYKTDTLETRNFYNERKYARIAKKLDKQMLNFLMEQQVK